MAGLNLQANEVVLMKHDQLSRKSSTFATETGDFVLTNLFLVWTSKNLFGNVKNMQQIPLNSIKVYNGKAQILVNKVNGEFPKLTVYCLNGQEVFEFLGKTEDELKIMANSINQAITKSNDNIYDVKSNAIIGAAAAAEMLKDTVNVFKDAFGVKVKKQDDNVIEKIAKKCNSCGAPISGIKGHIINCDYCDSNQQI